MLGHLQRLGKLLYSSYAGHPLSKLNMRDVAGVEIRKGRKFFLLKSSYSPRDPQSFTVVHGAFENGK
jgi:hypothetical protein